jgi:DNA modification methylase
LRPRFDNGLVYSEFLTRKLKPPDLKGKAVGIEDIHPLLYPFQRSLVKWALGKGRCALFADCGLGKTLMQLEWARLLEVPTLLIAPLAVAQQTQQEALKLKLSVSYVRAQSEVTGALSITNYEMADRFDPESFQAVVLDESSILKSFDGKTRTKLIQLFGRVPYRLCCTATPAPNDIAEIANHAEFLGIMTRQEMLAEFFVHDDEGWRLKGHAKEAFYRWMASWGMTLKTPSDIGDALKVAQSQGMLFPDTLKGITGRSAARKGTLAQRVERAASIINASTEQWIVWCGLNDEGRLLSKATPDSILVEGQDSLAAKIEAIDQFLTGEKRVLITKSRIAGFGMNFQNCHRMLFLGINDSYESYYQAIRRCWRYGQDHPVDVMVVISDLELPILENVQRKQAQAEDLRQNIINNIAEFEQAELGTMTIETNGYHPRMEGSESYQLMLGDCVERMAEIPDGSVDFSIFSPPFLSLYVYSESERDMGNSRSPNEFFEHFSYMLEELYRVMKSGRVVAVHVAQVASTLNNDGVIGIKDFRGQVIDALIAHGLIYFGDVTIDKNPQAQAIRTHSKSLLFKQLHKDASWLRPGLADYLLIFRKPGEPETPILPDITNEEWITWAHPVWYDIRESDTLNVAEARTNQDERHVCPLQLGLINRAIRLWSNSGETVLSPFAGIGSEGYEAIKLGRKFIGIELKESYWQTAKRNLDRASREITQQVLM